VTPAELRYLRGMRNSLLLIVSLLLTNHTAQSATITGIEASVYFSPNGGSTEAIISAISSAKRAVFVQAYSFTSVPIATALRDAHRRGVAVCVIVDKTQRSERYTSATFLDNEGITVLVDEKPKIAHSKVMIIDGETVITGSFNFTKGAEFSNVENLLVIKSGKLAAVYLEEWRRRESASVPYVRK
jgi:phosphatidylserine/phosphatidylglycerophosphate/cardiolipin synthase-like enzyme